MADRHTAKRRKTQSSTEDRISRMYGCLKHSENHLSGLMMSCVNCRLGVEAAQARAYVRKLRSLKNKAECTSSKCIAFIESVEDPVLRAHFTSMAWWRFSLDHKDPGTKVLYRMMTSAPAPDLVFCDEYMHTAMRELARCTPSQMLAWFGHETPYQAVMFYSGRDRSCRGEHCEKCAMLTRGCPQADTSAASSCDLWADSTIQRTMAGVAKVSCDNSDEEDDEEDNGYDDENGANAQAVQEGRTSGSGTDCDDNSAADNNCGPEIELAY